MIRRSVSKASSFDDIEGATDNTLSWPDDTSCGRRNTASKTWPRILCVLAAGAILLQVAYLMPNRLSSEPEPATHSAFTADVPLAENEPRKDDSLDQESPYAERMRKLKMKEEERMRAQKTTRAEEAAEVRKVEAMVGIAPNHAICIDSKTDCRSWAKEGECSKNWHFMHTECKLSCSLLPGYAAAFDCRPPPGAEPLVLAGSSLFKDKPDAAKVRDASQAQAKMEERRVAAEAIKASDAADAAAAREKATADNAAKAEANAAAAKKSRAAADAVRAEADAKRKAAADAARAEADAAAKMKAAADAAKAEADAAAKMKAAADAAKAEEEEAAKRKAAADAFKASEADLEAAAKTNAAAGADPAACADRNARCAEWKGMGECDSNPKFMLSTCRKSCDKCEPAPACVDTSNRCAEWTGSGECDRNPDFMLKTCRKSCGKCEPSPAL